MATAAPQDKVSLKRLGAFAFPSLPLAAMGLPLVVQLPPHYVGYVGLSSAIVGIIFMAARLLDIVVDLTLGLAMDQTRTRLGRFTPWLLASGPLLAIGAYFLFMAPAATVGADGKFITSGVTPLYAGIVLFLAYVAFSMGVLAQLSVGSTLTTDYNERARVFSWWQGGNIVGMLLVLAIPVIVHQNGGTEAQGVQGMGWFIIVMMPIAVLISAWGAREPPPKAAAHKNNLADFVPLMKSKATRMLLGTDLLASMASGVTGGLFLFMLGGIMGFGGGASLLMLIYFIAGLLGAPIWAVMAKKIGKHAALIVVLICASAFQLSVSFLPHADETAFGLSGLAVTGGGLFIGGLAYAAPMILMRAMMADIGDEDLLVTGKDRTGMLFALVTLTSKAGYALAVGVTYTLLSVFGYNGKPGATNTEFAIDGVTALFIGLPVALNIICMLLMAKYPLTEAKTRAIQAALIEKGLTAEARHAAALKEAEEVAKPA
jgi:glycoside/pentoside/hexuronide:cation symporter, GPH family